MFKKIIFLGPVALVAMLAVFFLGAYAHKSCFSYFCSGGLYKLQAEVLARSDTPIAQYEIQVPGGVWVGEDIFMPEDSGPHHNYGAAFFFQNEIYVVSQMGKILRHEGDQFVQSSLPDVPTRHKEYVEATASAGSVAQDYFYGVRDAVVTAGDDATLWISSHTFNSGCTNFSLFGLVLDGRNIWTEVPVLQCVTGSLRASGGAISWSPSNDGSLVVFTGDYGWFRQVSAKGPLLNQQLRETFPSGSHGVAFKLDTESLDLDVFATGFRNPQGAIPAYLNDYLDDQYWAVESGPQGGDELNLVKSYADYGWPDVTNGVQYGELEWPLRRDRPSERPTFYWVPSIAPSSIAQLRCKAGGCVEVNLVVSTLKDQSLYFLTLDKNERRVEMSTRVDLGARLRSVDIQDDRAIILYDLSRKVSILEIK